MLTIIGITALVAIAIPATIYVGLKLAEWVDGEAGWIIRRRNELMAQGGYTSEQAEEQACKELAERKSWK